MISLQNVMVKRKVNGQILQNYGSVALHGTGNGSGTRKRWVTTHYAELFILHWDREWDWTQLGFIPIFPFPLPFPVPVPRSVYEPLVSIIDHGSPVRPASWSCIFSNSIGVVTTIWHIPAPAPAIISRGSVRRPLKHYK